MQAARRPWVWRTWSPQAYVRTAIGLLLLALLAHAVDWNFVSQLDFSVVYKYRLALLNGLYNTLLVTFLALLIGSLVGLILAIAYQTRSKPIRCLIAGYVELWRNTPLLAQVFWIHFALPVATGISTSIFVSGLMALSLQASAYLAEISRAGILAVPKGQWEAAHALGLAAYPRWTKVILPQALKIMIPPFVNTSFSFFKGSTILSILGVGELMHASSLIANYTNKPIEVLTVAGLIYLVLGIVFSGLATRLERALGPADARRS